jgi:hypothetical protein
MSAWALTAMDTLAPGQRIVRRLGGGTAHEAFLVEAGDLDRRVVAKLPRPHLVEDPHCLLRLRHEGRTLQRLTHPALPCHLDTVLAGPYPHLLLEHVPGPTLRTVVLGGTRLAAPLVAALHEALAGRLLASPSVPNATTLAGPVGALLGHALTPSPSDRPTAAQFADALAEWADDPETETVDLLVGREEGLAAAV